MTTLQFVDTHNLVVFLAKPAESEGFEQIVDFLNAHTIKYALTVNPTIYTSCIEQFWATVKVKTVNGEVQLQALVDGKKIIVTEASIRSDLQLNDEEGMDCLPNATIFEELTRMGYEKLSQKLTFYKAFFSPQWKFLIHTILQCLSAKTTAWNEFSSTMASAIICLATNQKFNFSKYIFESMVKNLDNADEAVYEERDDSLERATTTATSLDAEQDMGGGPRCQETMGDIIAQTRSENVSKQFNDPLLARGNTLRTSEDRLKLQELMELCTNLQNKVIDMENTKTAQAQEITSLKLRVKRLENKGGSRTHKLKRLYKICRSARVISSDEASLGDQEDASKQGRKTNDIDKDAEITLVHETQGEPEVTIKDVNLSVDKVTLAQALAALKTVSTRPRAKGLIIHEEEQTTTPTVSLQQPSQLKVQDKGKGKMEEPEKPMKKKELIRLDEEVRLAREKAEKEEKANIVAWDNVQAMIDADYQMAQQMQAEEQEELSIEEKSKLFVQLLEARKKHFAAMRAQEERNKPPTKAQKRKTMSTYLKNMAGYNHNQLKNKSFDDIQKLFDKAMKRVNIFVYMDTELVEGSEVRAEGKDKEIVELQRLIKVVLDKEEVAIDDIPLATKPPSIVDWKIHKEGKKSYYQIIRADESLKMYLVFSHMLKSFDREDLETLYKLVKASIGQQDQ
ncbi:hypothetical protein Tco_0580252 [Tanacetum coccineum]